MTPLDLRLHPPRPCRAELDGIIFLPRAIDKVRASLPGGNMGAYLNLAEIPTMSSLFYHRLGIAHDEFAATVARADDDAEVAAWLRARVDDAAVAKLRNQLLALRLGALAPEARAGVNALYAGGAAAGDDVLLIDLIDQDDAAAFAR